MRLRLPWLVRYDPFWGVVVVLLGAALGVSSLVVTPGLPNTADGPLHLFRALELRWAWEQGVLYPRWAPHFAYGLGYPIFNYVPPLLGFLTAGLGLTDVAMQDALKLVAAGAVAAGGLGTYLLARRFLSPTAAAVAGLAYCLTPYRLFELYIQGNYPQLLSTGIAPFCLWGLARLSARGDRVGFLALALAIAAITVAHNISVVMFAPLLACYGLWRVWRRRSQRVVPMALAVLGGVLVGAFFWLPALAESSYVQTWRLTRHFFDFRQHFLSLEELFAFPQELDFRASNPYFPFSLGGHLVLLALPSLAWLGRQHGEPARLPGSGEAGRDGAASGSRPEDGVRGHVVFMWSALLGYVWLMLPASQMVWSSVPLLGYIEFPHRLLGPASLPLALLVGAAVEAWGRPGSLWGRGFWGAAVVVVLVGAAPYAFPRKPFLDWSGYRAEDVTDFEMRTGAIGTTSAAEYTPRWATERPTPEVAADARRKVTVLDTGPTWARVQVTAERPGPVVLPFLYFPGWQGHADDGPVAVSPGELHGLVEISLPSAGVQDVELVLRQTSLQRQSWWASLAGLGLVALGTLSVRSRVGSPEGDRTATEPWLRLSAAALGLLVVAKVAYLEPHTMLFRLQSPPGTVLRTQHPLEVIFAGRIALLGYDLERSLPPQGEPLSVVLYWQPLGGLAEDYHVFVHLVSLADGQVVVRSEKAAPGGVPSSKWHPALYVEDRHRLPLPQDLLPVRYALRVGLYDPRAEAELVGPGGETSVVLQEVQVLYNRPLDIRRFPGKEWFGFGEKVRLLGFDLDRTELAAGQSAELTLYWRAEARVSERLKRFVHLVNGSGTIVAQWDEWPVAGAYPTDLWLPQHNIADPVTVTVPASAGPGEYTLVVGLYDAESLTRPEVRRRGTERVPGDAVVLPLVVRVLG
ncbi:MAG: hypothetical protein HPY83_14500 [Anaerolineae bacterium]|nr:hypothetical protein [Anaerolineae bacterium]